MYCCDDVQCSEIAVLVLSTRQPAYDLFQQAVYHAWLDKLASSGVVCYFYAGDYPVDRIHGCSIELNVPDDLANTSRKLMAAVDVLLSSHPNIKLIYRTNLSSFIEVDNFLAFIHRHRLGSSTYCGIVGKTTFLRERFYGHWLLYNAIRILRLGSEVKFASGSGFFLGVEHASRLPGNTFYTFLIDDVMVAKSFGISPDENCIPLRFDVLDHDVHKVSMQNYLSQVNDGLLFHYRFKTSDRARDAQMLLHFDDPDFRLATCVGMD